jgi:Phage tail tube protein
MPLAEGVSRSIRYKAYASATITANALAVSSSDLATTGGQILRRVSSSLKLAKDTYQSAEIRTDRQIADFRHGVKRATGSVTGELSPATWFDFFEAACRGTKSAATITASEADFTSIVGAASTSNFTLTGGDPVTKGFRIGDVIRFTNLSVAGNNATNFLITGFSGASNRIIAVFPAPLDQVSDAAFNVASVGKSIFVPSSSFVSRKFGIEQYSSDTDTTQLFTECRCGGFTLQLPATGMATIEVPFMGRDMENLSGANAPFFTAPTAETTTGIIAAVNGLLQVNGVTQGVVTAAQIRFDLNPSSDGVVGQNFVPEIFLGRANVSGQLTAFFQDNTLIDQFKNESSVGVLLYLTATSAVNAPAMTIWIPKIKFGDAAINTQGEGGQSITMPFQALKGDATLPGDLATTIRITDTEAT